MTDLVKVTGLWASKDKNGNPVLSGRMGNAKVLIFKNTKKEKENQPDYTLYLAQFVKADEGEPVKNDDPQPFDRPF